MRRLHLDGTSDRDIFGTFSVGTNVSQVKSVEEFRIIDGLVDKKDTIRSARGCRGDLNIGVTTKVSVLNETFDPLVYVSTYSN